MSTQAADPLNELTRPADTALYRAKFRGRNRAEFELDQVTSEVDIAEFTFAAICDL